MGNCFIKNVPVAPVSPYRDTGLLWIYKEQLKFKTIPPSGDFKAYGQVILNCCKGDGEIHEEERTFVLGYFACFGCPDDVLDYLKTYDGEVDMATAAGASMQVQQCTTAAVYDAVRACQADSKVHAIDERELEAIKGMAATLDVTGDTVDKIVSIIAEERTIKNTRLQVRRFAPLILVKYRDCSPGDWPYYICCACVLESLSSIIRVGLYQFTNL